MLGRLLDLLGSALAIVVVIAVTGCYFLIRRALAPVEEITRRAEFEGAPRSFSDYVVVVHEDRLPKGVCLLQKHLDICNE